VPVFLISRNRPAQRDTAIRGHQPVPGISIAIPQQPRQLVAATPERFIDDTLAGATPGPAAGRIL
jgi:hypothetical protein